MMVQPSFIRPGSDLHGACIELYQRHRDRDDGSGSVAGQPLARSAATRLWRSARPAKIRDGMTGNFQALRLQTLARHSRQ